MSKGSYGTKAEMLPGDFHLRRDDRQMFGNFVVLSAGGGRSGALAKVRRSATFVETPVYEVPKFWKLDISFQALESSPAAPLSPWVPAALSTNVVRVTVRRALDRDKATVTEVFDLRALTNAPNQQVAMPQRFFSGFQVAVTAEILGSGSLATIGTQVSLVELTAIDRDPYRNAIAQALPQSDSTQTFLLPNERRRQFFVQNMGTAPLFVAFDFFAVVPGAGAHYTVALLSHGDIYESPRDCYQGYVSGVWTVDGAAAADQALVTEGF